MLVGRIKKDKRKPLTYVKFNESGTFKKEQIKLTLKITI